MIQEVSHGFLCDSSRLTTASIPPPPTTHTHTTQSEMKKAFKESYLPLTLVKLEKCAAENNCEEGWIYGTKVCHPMHWSNVHTISTVHMSTIVNSFALH